MRVTVQQHEVMRYRCDKCDQCFKGPAQLAVHKAKKHGERAMQTHAWGTACEICRRQYWSTARLREHFRRSPGCAFAYQQAEIDAGAPTEQIANRSTPPTALIGPSPWWATLRPRRTHVAAHPTPASRVPSLDVNALRELHQIPTFVNHWLGQVETGVSWHVGFQDEDWRRPLVQIAELIAENAYRDDGELFLAAGDLAAVMQGDKVLLGPTAALMDARVTLWPYL